VAPQARLLRAYLAYTRCHYDAARSELGEYQRVHGAKAEALAAFIDSVAQTNPSLGFAQLAKAAREGRASAPPEVQPVLLRALGEHGIAGMLTWLAQLEAQQATLAGLRELASTPIGREARAALDDEHLRVRRLLDAQLQRYLTDEQERLAQTNADAQALVSAVETASPTRAPRDRSQMTPSDAQIYGVAIPRNVLLPFSAVMPYDDRRLESSYFHQTQITQCAR
jgi:hypothetical protein